MTSDRDPNDRDVRNAPVTGTAWVPYHRRRSTWGATFTLLLVLVGIIIAVVWWYWADEPDVPAAPAAAAVEEPASAPAEPITFP